MHALSIFMHILIVYLVVAFGFCFYIKIKIEMSKFKCHKSSQNKVKEMRKKMSEDFLHRRKSDVRKSQVIQWMLFVWNLRPHRYIDKPICVEIEITTLPMCQCDLNCSASYSLYALSKLGTKYHISIGAPIQETNKLFKWLVFITAKTSHEFSVHVSEVEIRNEFKSNKYFKNAWTSFHALSVLFSAYTFINCSLLSK